MVEQEAPQMRSLRAFLCMFSWQKQFRGHQLITCCRIGWPFGADQPVNIAHLVHTLDVAFELIEVRTGDHGLKSIYATGKTPQGTLEAFREELNGVLDSLSSEIGRRKRANAQKQQKILAQAWAPGGPAYVSFQNLIQKFDL
jgi:hypothetical protein